MPRSTLRPKKQLAPEFATEAAEAAWWDSRRDTVENDLANALRKGTALRDSAQIATQQARSSKNVTIRMAVADVDRARKLSAQKGIGYQTLVKMLLHEALDREERRLT